jgi:orotate phosphoribosyltransferase-like protein
MKNKEQEKAIAKKLRQNEGLSIQRISEILKVSKSSVSLWVRDIILTEQQKTNLFLNNKNACRNGEKIRQKAKNKRLGYHMKENFYDDIYLAWSFNCSFSIYYLYVFQK